MALQNKSPQPPSPVPLTPKDRKRMEKLYKEVASRAKEIARITAKTVGQPPTLAESTRTVEISLPTSGKAAGTQPDWIAKVRFHASAASGKPITGAKDAGRVLVYGYSDSV